jgi:hypothetical protein
MRPDAEVASLTVVAPDGQLEVHLVERTGAHEAELHRAIALKLRSVLTGTATPEPAVRVPAQPVVPPAPPPPAPPPRAPAATVVRAPPPAPSPAPGSRLFASVGYRVSTPIDAASPRHALAIDGALALGRQFEIDAGTEVAPRRTQRLTDGGGTDTLSIFDWPITVGARLVRRGPRFSFGGGLFAACHLLWATATADDGQASSFTAMGGAGADVIGRARLAPGLAAELRLYAEIPVPTTGYTVRGTPAVDVGARAGAGLGLAFPAP